MSYYRTCPGCGCNLDPGEVCDECRQSENREFDLRTERERLERLVRAQGGPRMTPIQCVRKGNRLTLEYMRRVGNRI